MKLRARIALTTLSALTPLVAGLVALVVSLRLQAMEESLAQYAYTAAVSGRAACEAAPERWGGPVAVAPGPMPIDLELYAYDTELRAAHPSAPTLAPEMVAAARAGEARIRHFSDVYAVLVRSQDAGPCAYVLVRRSAATLIPGPTRGPPLLLGLLVISLLVLGVVLALLGPIVRRLKRLRDEVRASAASGYHRAVTIQGDDELAELAAAFEDSGRQLFRHLEAQERRERTLREFLANTTHDVMVPLTVLQGHLAALHAHGVTTDDVVLRGAMQEADYIASLVHNLEVAARLDAGEPELARFPVELSPLIARVTMRHTPLARRRSVELAHAAPSRPLVVIGDVTMIEQAVSNLVQNSVLHNHAGGHVAVVLEMDDADHFRILVKDDGPGATSEELARMLGRGERGDAARTRHPHGKGLGLSIARRVAAAHGWCLEIRPAPEGGLEVELRGAVTAPSRPAN